MYSVYPCISFYGIVSACVCMYRHVGLFRGPPARGPLRGCVRALSLYSRPPTLVHLFASARTAAARSGGLGPWTAKPRKYKAHRKPHATCTWHFAGPISHQQKVIRSYSTQVTAVISLGSILCVQLYSCTLYSLVYRLQLCTVRPEYYLRPVEDCESAWRGQNYH